MKTKITKIKIEGQDGDETPLDVRLKRICDTRLNVGYPLVSTFKEEGYIYLIFQKLSSVS